MLNFLIKFHESFGESISESAIIILMDLLILIIIGLVIYGVYVLIDSSFSQSYESDGIISNKTFTAAYTQWISTGKTTAPICHPDNYELQIKIGDNYGNVSVVKEFYESAKIGDYVLAKYSIGRINRNNIYIKDISK